jgi:hypothetical protein
MGPQHVQQKWEPVLRKGHAQTTIRHVFAAVTGSG